MPSRDPRLYLRDIVENIEKARSFTDGMTSEEFGADSKTLYATIRALEIISEASRHISDAVKERYPDLPWRQISDSGNVYRHVYLAVDAERIWSTVTQGLQALYAAASEELEREDGT